MEWMAKVALLGSTGFLGQAVAPALLAAGLLATAKPLLSALAGAVALLYDPIIAAPFWAIVLLALFVDRHCRKMLRPILPILLVSILLLANLAQLQPQMAADQKKLDDDTNHGSKSGVQYGDVSLDSSIE